MAVLRLEFDVDSEVYPELHELLASIGSGAAREERLRQLAATGLIWERTRLRAQADAIEATPMAEAATAQAGLTAPNARQIPVLTDVVDPSEVSGVNQAVVLHASADGGGVGANDPVHDLPAARQQAHRSRLKRMRERGLFKNE